MQEKNEGGEDPKSILKSSIKQYKQLIRKRGLQRNSEVTASVDNILIKFDNKSVKNGKPPKDEGLRKISPQKSHKNTTINLPRVPLKDRKKAENQISYRKNNKSQNSLALGYKSISPERSRTIEKGTRHSSVVKSQRKSHQKAVVQNFKPYTIRDYKQNFADSQAKYPSRGVLGPSKDEKWENAMNSLKKMKYFGSVTRHKNNENNKGKLNLILNKRALLKKINNSRFKALEFAKTIRKPKLTTSPRNGEDEEYEKEIEERKKHFDRLPLYKKNIKFEEEAIKMFYN
jgi:hypothetical protein